MIEILTVGHGDLDLEQLIQNLREARVGRLVDVRSVPYSRRHPQFNRNSLQYATRECGITYEWEPALGGRPSDPSLLTDGKPDYEKMAQTDTFGEALQGLIDSSEYVATAIMCSEGRPEQCHRALLVSRALIGSGIRVSHLLKDGTRTDDVPLPVRLL